MKNFESSSANTPQAGIEETFISKELSKNVESYNNHEIMEEMELMATSLIEKMKDKIDEGAYDLIISDEGSGRLPTMLFRKIYQARNPGKDFDTIFMNGAHSERDPGVSSKAQWLKREYDKGRRHAIIVSDYAETGKTLSHFSNNFRYLTSMTGVSFSDVSAAVLRTAFDEHSRSDGVNQKFKDLFVGEILPVIPKITAHTEVTRKLMGTKKNKDE
ncbi:hypothetical protein H7X65_02125, partial [Candidatus Parcubacteria bacterium]|nr:hypothetical protein [Candidatus Parcubacteria bacterium]